MSPEESPGVVSDVTLEADATLELVGSVAVYDPALCCATGVCGPAADPALLTIARDLRWLQKRGVGVERFGLSREPGAFASNARVAGLLQAFGDSALPAVLVNDQVLCHGRYASRDELVAALRPRIASTPRSCCAPSNGCC